VAEKNKRIIDIDYTVYLDRLYVHRAYQGQGVAAAICDERDGGWGKIVAHASISARPFLNERVSDYQRTAGRTRGHSSYQFHYGKKQINLFLILPLAGGKALLLLTTMHGLLCGAIGGQDKQDKG